MDFFDNRYFRLNKVLTSVIGQWPYQSRKKKVILSFFFFYFQFSHTVGTIIGLITLHLNFDDTLNSVTLIISVPIISIKLLNSILNMRKMRSILDGLKSHWLLMSSSEVEILKECAVKGRFFMVAYTVAVYSGMSLFLLSTYVPPLLDMIKPLNESRPIKRVYRSNYFVDEEKYFYFLLFHEQLATICNMTTMICVDTMYAKCVEQTCRIFLVLQYRLENIIKNSGTIGHSSKEDEAITNEVFVCIAFHRNAIKLADAIESIYGTAVFMEITLSMVLLSSTGYVVAIKLETFAEFFQMLPKMLGQILHIFYNIRPGQQLMDHSEEIGNSVYGTQWYRMPIKAQKLLLLIMLRSFRPCTIKAFGGILTLSMETFSSCMKSSFSYFTFLFSMRD